MLTPSQEVIVRKFGVAHKGYLKNLSDYCQIKNKNYSWKEALYALFDLTNYNELEVRKIIRNMVSKRKNYGYQAYNDTVRNNVNLVKNSDGTFQLLNYNPGMFDKPADSTTDSDGNAGNNKQRPSAAEKNKNRLMNRNQSVTREKIYDLGHWLRDLKPTASNDDITNMMEVVRDYITKKKISYDKFKQLVDTERLRIVKTPSGYQVMPAVYESKGKKIVLGKGLDLISEDIDNILQEVTFQAFSHGIKQFLAGLMDSPVDAKPNQLMIANGLNRSKLIGYLLRMGMLIKDEKIVDKDENGNPVTASMSIKFKIPKKDFDRKLKKLYIKLFEKNLPSKEETPLEEEGGFGGATSANVSAAGSFIQPMAPIIRRKFNDRGGTK